MASDCPLEILRMPAPAAPGRGDARFLLVRCPFANGVLRILWSWRGSVKGVDFGRPMIVETGSERHELSGNEKGYSMIIHSGGARSSIDFVYPARSVQGRATETYSVEYDVEGDEVGGPIHVL